MYIGQTTKNLSHRRNKHLCAAKANSALLFHKAIRKYGAENFVWDVIATCSDKEQLNSVEKFYIELIKPEYNLATGGNSNSGFKHSTKTREKMSKSSIGKRLGNQYRKGKKLSQSSKNKIALIKGKPFKVFLNNEEVGIWVNQSQCAIDLKLSQAKISQCLLGKIKRHKRYTFCYAKVRFQV